MLSDTGGLEGMPHSKAESVTDISLLVSTNSCFVSHTRGARRQGRKDSDHCSGSLSQLFWKLLGYAMLASWLLAIGVGAYRSLDSDVGVAAITLVAQVSSSMILTGGNKLTQDQTKLTAFFLCLEGGLLGKLVSSWVHFCSVVGLGQPKRKTDHQEEQRDAVTPGPLFRHRHRKRVE